MGKNTRFELNLNERRRRLANVRFSVSEDRTRVDAVAFGNQNAVPLACGLLLMAANAFASPGRLAEAILAALKEYDGDVVIEEAPDEQFVARQPPLNVDDLPF